MLRHSHSRREPNEGLRDGRGISSKSSDEVAHSQSPRTQLHPRISGRGRGETSTSQQEHRNTGAGRGAGGRREGGGPRALLATPLQGASQKEHRNTGLGGSRGEGGGEVATTIAFRISHMCSTKHTPKEARGEPDPTLPSLAALGVEACPRPGGILSPRSLTPPSPLATPQKKSPPPPGPAGPSQDNTAAQDQHSFGAMAQR